MTAIRRFPGHVAGMYLNPIDGAGHFWIEDFTITQVSSAKVLLEIAHRGLRQATGAPARLAEWCRIAWRIWRGGNLNSLKIFVARWLEQSELDYRTWIAYHDSLTDLDRAAIRARITGFERSVRFSIVIRLGGTPQDRLRSCLDSVIDQLYPDWELWIAHAADPVHVGALVQEYVRRDDRVRVVTDSPEGGLVGACNRAVALATGGYIVLLDPDSMLAEHACHLFAETVTADPDLELVYADEDEINASGERASPWFKGDWDAVRILQQDYVSRCCAVSTRLLREVGGFRADCEDGLAYDLVLRCALASAPKRIGHVPFVIYHAHRTADVRATDRAGLRAHIAGVQRAVADRLTATGSRRRSNRCRHRKY
ncbi:MAG: glycosyltransferase [Burkholderiales bacterium]